MIITVEQLKQYITAEKTDYITTEKNVKVLEAMLQALEVAIRKYTNNNFQNRSIRFKSNTSEIRTQFTQYLNIGDTLQVSESAINNGLYTIKAIVGDIISLNEPIFSEQEALFTKVEYPADIQLGVVEIMRWKLKNEDQNYNPEAEKNVQSESISRHSVTYAKDTTEEDIDAEFGVPKKYTSFLKMYKKARF